MNGFCTWRGEIDDTAPDTMPVIISMVGCRSIRFILAPDGDGFSLKYKNGGRDRLQIAIQDIPREAITGERDRIISWLKSRPLMYSVPAGALPLAKDSPDPWVEYAARIGVQWAWTNALDWLTYQASIYVERFPSWGGVAAMRAAFRDLDEWQKGDNEL